MREHLPKKEILSGIARMRGDEALARIKKYTLYNLGNARKKTFFFSGGVPQWVWRDPEMIYKMIHVI